MHEVMIQRPRRQGATVRTSAWRVLAAAVSLAQILQDEAPALSGADADRKLQAFVAFAFRCEAATETELLQHVEDQRMRMATWRSLGLPVHQPRQWLLYAEGALSRRFGAGWRATR